jgi:hypothetical protein
MRMHVPDPLVSCACGCLLSCCCCWSGSELLSKTRTAYRAVSCSSETPGSEVGVCDRSERHNCVYTTSQVDRGCERSCVCPCVQRGGSPAALVDVQLGAKKIWLFVLFVNLP